MIPTSKRWNHYGKKQKKSVEIYVRDIYLLKTLIILFNIKIFLDNDTDNFMIA